MERLLLFKALFNSFLEILIVKHFGLQIRISKQQVALPNSIRIIEEEGFPRVQKEESLVFKGLLSFKQLAFNL